MYDTFDSQILFPDCFPLVNIFYSSLNQQSLNTLLFFSIHYTLVVFWPTMNIFKRLGSYRKLELAEDEIDDSVGKTSQICPCPDGKTVNILHCAPISNSIVVESPGTDLDHTPSPDDELHDEERILDGEDNETVIELYQAVDELQSKESKGMKLSSYNKYFDFTNYVPDINIIGEGH